MNYRVSKCGPWPLRWLLGGEISKERKMNLQLIGRYGGQVWRCIGIKVNGHVERKERR